MKKFTKKLTFAVVMVLTLALFFSVFVACNNNTDPDPDNEPGTTVTPGGDTDSGDDGSDDGQTPVTPGGDENPDEGGDDQGTVTPGGDDQGSVTPGGDDQGSETPGGDENPVTPPATSFFPEGAQKTWYTSDGVAIVISANTLTYDGSAAVESSYYTSTNTAGTVTYYHFSVGMLNTPYAIYTDGTDWYIAEVRNGNVLVDFAETLSDEAPEAGITEIPSAFIGTWQDGNGISIEITLTSVNESGTPLSIDNEEIFVTQNEDGTYTITDADEFFALTNNENGTLTYVYTDSNWEKQTATLKQVFNVTVETLAYAKIANVTVTISGVSATTGEDGVATLVSIPGAIQLSGYDTEKYTYYGETAVAGDSDYYIFLGEDVTNTFYVKAGSTGLSGITVKVMDGDTVIASGTTGSEGSVELTYAGKYDTSARYKAVLEGLNEDTYSFSATTFSKDQNGKSVTISVTEIVSHVITVVLGEDIGPNDVSVSGLTVGLYKQTMSGESLVASGTTDDNGTVTIKAAYYSDGYTVKVSGLASKYLAEGTVGGYGATNSATITIEELAMMTLDQAFTVDVTVDKNSYEWSTVKVIFTSENGGSYVLTLNSGTVAGANVFTKEGYAISLPTLYDDMEDYNVTTYYFTLEEGDSIVFIATASIYDDEITSHSYTLTVSTVTPVTVLSAGDNLVYGTNTGAELSFTATTAGTYVFSSSDENFFMEYGDGDEDFANAYNPYEVELAEGQTITLTFYTYEYLSDGDYYVVNIANAEDAE